MKSYCPFDEKVWCSELTQPQDGLTHWCLDLRDDSRTFGLSSSQGLRLDNAATTPVLRRQERHNKLTTTALIRPGLKIAVCNTTRGGDMCAHIRNTLPQAEPAGIHCFYRKAVLILMFTLKSEVTAVFIFCSGRQLENRTKKEWSLWFPDTILLSIVGSPTGTEALWVRLRPLINAIVSERRHVCRVAWSAFYHAAQ